MKKKKVIVSEITGHIIYDQSIIIIKESDGSLTFESKDILTTDLMEGVAIMLKLVAKNDKIWNYKFTCNPESVSPERSLYWLSGGDSEWNTLEHYNKPWSEYYLDFQKQYGITIIDIIETSSTLMDIRNKIIKYLNLPTIYEFALDKNMIRI